MAKAKKKTVTRAPRAARKLKTPKFVAYTASATHLFAITKDAKCYVWNGLEGAFVPNWDVDGSMRAAIASKQLADEIAKRNAAAEASAPIPLKRAVAQGKVAPTEAFE